MSEPNRYTICVDLDGVLHAYDGKWAGHHVIEGGPNSGAIQWLDEITEHFDIAVLTTRSFTIDGRNAVWAWLQRHCSPETLQRVAVVSHKPPALLYIDDRAWRFEGDNWPSRAQVHKALPWWKA